MRLFRLIVILSYALNLIGCATAELLSDQMQPDGSYRIIAFTNTLTARLAKQTAHERAKALCPLGFQIRTEFADNQSMNPKYQLIVKCQDSEK